VDTGLDTRHVEFQNKHPITGLPINNRVVRNIFDVYAQEEAFEKTGDFKYLQDDYLQFNPTKNNDYVGHGTHVAGTIGGNNVGVSPGVDIFGKFKMIFFYTVDILFHVD